MNAVRQRVAMMLAACVLLTGSSRLDAATFEWTFTGTLAVFQATYADPSHPLHGTCYDISSLFAVGDSWQADKEKSTPAGEGVFTSSAGKFSARFPFGEPTVKSEVQSGVTWHQTESNVGMYNVSYADFPDAARANAAMAEYLTNMKDLHAGLRDLTVAGVPGKEVIFQISKDATMWLRLVVVGNRFYKIAAGNKNDKAKAAEFLDSFELKG